MEHRPDPERLLAQIQREEKRSRRGHLKIFLGYSSGVGKSEKMLDEGWRRRKRGEDVVVAAVQRKSTPEIDTILAKYEIVPTLNIDNRDVLDIVALLKRRPHVVLVDGLAHNNPPGSRNLQRWKDIEELLEAGISVMTSINLQYIEEMQEEVACITGKQVTETVPLAFLKRAEDIEIIDAPAQEEQSARLREMALLVAAEVVEAELRHYLDAHHIQENWGIQERILVGITPRSDARSILESGKRNADRFHGNLLVAYIRQAGLSAEDQASLDRNLQIANELGAEVHILEGTDPVRTLVEFAREKGVTQIFIGHSQRRGFWNAVRGNPVDRVIDLAEGIDVRVFPQRTTE
jgi:two-component system sensor histidine kinase KdpD